ncbi:phage tail tube protein [Cereibacter changlensis]|uniref:phage tail tube protein n=1 Tax=Cereibacter changlensis TaxID=402884 RepID=UPI004033A372
MPSYSIGIGSQVRIGRTSGNTVNWTVMAGVQDITLPEQSVDEIDVTAMDSPNRTKQTIPGLTSNEDVSLDMVWSPGSDTDVCLSAIRASAEIVQVEFTIVGLAEPEIYKGWLKTYSRTAPVQDRLEASTTFKINEKVIA